MNKENIIASTFVLAITFFLISCKAELNSVSQQVSASGMPYTLVKMPGNDRVSIHTAWPSSWASEDKNQAVPQVGAQLLLAGGAEGYKAEDVPESMQDMGSEAALSAGLFHVYGTVHYSPEHQTETMKLANAHLRAPLLDDTWLVRVRDGISQSVSELGSVPGYQLSQTVQWSLFGEHPNREFLLLDVQDNIDAVSREGVQDWVQSTFIRNGVSVVISGDIDAETAGAAIDSLFEGLSEGTTPTLQPTPVDFSAKRILLHTPDSETSTISILGKMPSTKEGHHFEDVLLITDFGGPGDQSILFKLVRGELNASYAFSASIIPLTSDNRILEFSGQVEDNKVSEVAAAVVNAYADFKKSGSTANLSEFKSSIKDDLADSSKDTGITGFVALSAILDDRDPSRAIDAAAKLDAVTDASIQERLSKSYPSADELIVVVSSANRDALEGACVIDNPEDVVDCK